jgi:aspartate racemase
VATIPARRGDGAEAVVLGCTEIPLLVRPGGSPLPAFDTTALHAAAELAFLLGSGEPVTG